VQTPTLAILARREKELLNFVAEDYWVVEALFNAAKGEYSGTYEKGKKLTEQQANQIMAQVNNKPGVAEVTEKGFSEKPPLLYDLTTIQREASSKFAFTADKTLSILQTLYEAEKVITYPRTNSRYLSSDMVDSFPDLLKQLESKYPTLAANAQLDQQKIVDDSKVTDHHAIIITNSNADYLSGDYAKLYDLIARRFIAVFYPPARGANKTIVTTVEQHKFHSKGKAYSELGWRAVYVKDASKLDKTLADVANSETVQTIKAQSVKKQTKPPKRYSDGTLLGAMESAGKDIDDTAARESMKENGLGTPATRASVIERLISVGYVDREKKNFVVTEKGLYVIDWLSGHPLLSPELTGKWEAKLLEMEKDASISDLFMKATDKMVNSTVTGIFSKDVPDPPESIKPKPRPAKQSIGECPSCGKPLFENKKAYSCWSPEDPGCGLAIWKTIAGKKLTKATVKQLIDTKKADSVSGFKSRSGKAFAAKLAIIEKNGKPQVSFDEQWAKPKQTVEDTGPVKAKPETQGAKE
jgi:DNA topoisomerase-3